MILPEFVILSSVNNDCCVPPRIRYVESSYPLFNTSSYPVGGIIFALFIIIPLLATTFKSFYLKSIISFWESSLKYNPSLLVFYLYLIVIPLLLAWFLY